MFGFRNPGRMRIPLQLAIQGGNSDCRNRRLQTMFQLVGYGDHAGSGLPKIYTNWADQHWRSPLLYEIAEPEQTLMELRMSSLVPEQVLGTLTARLGERFTALSETARLALITAHVEGLVSHDRLKQITAVHPADLTKLLGALVRDALLVPDGTGRGMVYFLPWQRHALATAFDTVEVDIPQSGGAKPQELTAKPQELTAKPQELGGSAPVVVVYLNWDDVPVEEKELLMALAAPIRDTRKAHADLLHATVLALCAGRYLGRHVLAHILDRNADDLLRRILNPMVEAGDLTPAYPAARDPRQAYTADKRV